jgi:hypothetical protein
VLVKNAPEIRAFHQCVFGTPESFLETPQKFFTECENQKRIFGEKPFPRVFHALQKNFDGFQRHEENKKTFGGSTCKYVLCQKSSGVF